MVAVSVLGVMKEEAKHGVALSQIQADFETYSYREALVNAVNQHLKMKRVGN